MCREHCARLLKLEYEDKCRGLKEAAQQKGYTEGPDGVLCMTDDDDDISAIANNYYPSAPKGDRLELDEWQKAEIAKLNETYEECLLTLDEVFHKASAPDRAGEVGISSLYLRMACNLCSPCLLPFLTALKLSFLNGSAYPAGTWLSLLSDYHGYL